MTNRKHPTSPPPYSYWAITDKLLAGEYPGDQHPRNYFRTLVSKAYSILGFLRRPNQGMMNSDKRIKAILDAGINTFLDLTELNELPEYEHKLNAINDSDNASIKYKRMAIEDRNVPEKEFLKEKEMPKTLTRTRAKSKINQLHNLTKHAYCRLERRSHATHRPL